MWTLSLSLFLLSPEFDARDGLEGSRDVTSSHSTAGELDMWWCIGNCSCIIQCVGVCTGSLEGLVSWLVL
jgi:hypothetical protein